MNLTEQDLKKIKALHVMIKMPVWIVAGDTGEVLKKYVSIYRQPISYEFRRKDVSGDLIRFYSGALNEIFLGIRYKEVQIVIGAFRINNVTKRAFSLVYDNLSGKNKEILTEEECWAYYSALPYYPLGDVRDYLILLGFLFDLDLEEAYSEEIHSSVEKNKLELAREMQERSERDIFRTEKYTFYYENRILNLVSQGNPELLKSGLADLGTSVLPLLTSNSLRTEKNYTVIILEKLTELAMQVGKDILSVIRLRNYYIQKTEEAEDLIGVLAVRDSATLHFTRELHGVTNRSKSSLIRCVLQYINLKIYDSIKISGLAKQFYLSESALRRKFKEEMGMSMNEYINGRKIEESKMMLRSGVPVGEIAKRLSFYDLSHFYRTFKKYTGMTPQMFRNETTKYEEMSGNEI